MMTIATVTITAMITKTTSTLTGSFPDAVEHMAT